MKIAYYGHASFAAEINGKHLLFDPFITQNPLAKAVDIKKIKAELSSSEELPLKRMSLCP